MCYVCISALDNIEPMSIQLHLSALSSFPLPREDTCITHLLLYPSTPCLVEDAENRAGSKVSDRIQ